MIAVYDEKLLLSNLKKKRKGRHSSTKSLIYPAHIPFIFGLNRTKLFYILFTIWLIDFDYCCIIVEYYIATVPVSDCCLFVVVWACLSMSLSAGMISSPNTWCAGTCDVPNSHKSPTHLHTSVSLCNVRATPKIVTKPMSVQHLKQTNQWQS